MTKTGAIYMTPIQCEFLLDSEKYTARPTTDKNIHNLSIVDLKSILIG